MFAVCSRWEYLEYTPLGMRRKRLMDEVSQPRPRGHRHVPQTD
jgi:hypothetical protein